MSKISVTTIAGLTSGGDANKVKIESGDTLQVESNATVGGTLAVTGATTTAAITSTGRHDVNFNGSGTQAFKYTDTGGGNLASFGQFYNPSNALIGNIQNANNDGIHLNIKNGSVVFSNVGYTAANALDDYEEGTWTPSLGGNTTYTNQAGKYTKVGRFVHADFDFTVNALGTGSASTLTGFPFPMGAYGGVLSGYCSYYTGLAVTVTYLSCYIISNTSNMYFTGHNVGAAANIGNALSVFQNSTRVLGSVAYYVAQ